MGEPGVEGGGVAGAVPAPGALGLLRPEGAPRRVGVPVVELVGWDLRPRRAQQAVGFGRQGDVPEPAQPAGVGRIFLFMVCITLGVSFISEIIKENEKV